jgi:hypothetical protein
MATKRAQATRFASNIPNEMPGSGSIPRLIRNLPGKTGTRMRPSRAFGRLYLPAASPSADESAIGPSQEAGDILGNQSSGRRENKLTGELSNDHMFFDTTATL